MILVSSGICNTMNCTVGEPYLTYTPFKIVILTQAVLCAVALVINPLIFRLLYFQAYFHRNIRILLGVCGIINIFHAAAFLILQGTHSFLMFTGNDGCDLLVSSTFCNVFRFPAYIAVMCYSSTTNTMVFERFVATLKVRNYEDKSGAFGIFLAAFSIVSAVAVSMYAISWPLATGEQPYCALMTSNNTNGVGAAALIGAIGQVLIGCMFIVVFYANKWLEKRPFFNVKAQYQIKENLTVCRMLSPWLFFHFLATFFLMASNYMILSVLQWDLSDMRAKTVVAAVNVMPVFSVLSPVALKVIYDREGRRRKAGIKELSKPFSAEEAYLTYTVAWNKA